MIHLATTQSIQKLPANTFNKLLRDLPQVLQNQILRYRKWEDQQRSLLGKVLLSTALKTTGFFSYSLHDLKFTSLKKPYFDDVLDFNISHSGDYVVCAISNTNKVGLDVEQIKNVPFTDFKINFTDSEWEDVLTTDNSLETFYKLWTRKEAFLKAIGMGLYIPLNQVVIAENKISWDRKEWFLREVRIDPHYSCHLCTDTSSPAIILERLDFK
jgi:4'-phosphopantetheinyl transferase